jgi:hypothetical protein
MKIKMEFKSIREMGSQMELGGVKLRCGVR